MAKDNKVFIWILVGVIALLAFGVINLPLGGNNNAGDDADDLYPSTLTTTITLNTGDALATSATQATVKYYVFTASGNFLKEGTTSSGTASFSVPTSGDYKIVAYYDEGGTDYLPIEKTFSTNGDNPQGRAVQTVNMDLYKESAATISAVRDPVDLDTNITASAGASVDFDVLIKATTAYAALNNPVIVVDVNSSEWQDASIGTLSEVVCPSRLTSGTEREKYCFQYDNKILSSDGIEMFSGNLVADSANAPASLSQVNITVIDAGLYIEPNYKTSGYNAFKMTSLQNPLSKADVGAADSSTSTLTVE
jgi:hypothetical protein